MRGNYFFSGRRHVYVSLCVVQQWPGVSVVDCMAWNGMAQLVGSPRESVVRQQGSKGESFGLDKSCPANTGFAPRDSPPRCCVAHARCGDGTAAR